MTQIELLCEFANCKASHLPNLTVLNAGCTKITDAGLAHLPNLTVLNADFTGITDAGKKMIADRRRTHGNDVEVVY